MTKSNNNDLFQLLDEDIDVKDLFFTYADLVVKYIAEGNDKNTAENKAYTLLSEAAEAKRSLAVSKYLKGKIKED